VVSQFTLDVPVGYGIDISDKVPSPQKWNPSTLSLVYTAGPTQISQHDGGRLAPLDSSAAVTYNACLANTRFTSTVYVHRDDKLCYTGRGYVAGVTMDKVVSDLSTQYLTLSIIVWQGIAT